MLDALNHHGGKNNYELEHPIYLGEPCALSGFSATLGWNNVLFVYLIIYLVSYFYIYLIICFDFSLI